MSVGQQNDRGGGQWEFYSEWVPGVLAALFTTFCCILFAGLSASGRLTSGTASQVTLGTGSGPTVAPAAMVPTVAAPAVVPAAAPTSVAASGPAGTATTVPASSTAPVVQTASATVTAGAYTIQGTGAAGSTVEVLVNGGAVGTTQVGADGRWSFETTLETGEATIGARLVDAAGTTVAQATAVSIDVQAAVEAPTFDAPPGAVVGGPAALTGTGTPGSRVRVSIDDTVVGTTVVGSDGNWELDTILSVGSPTVVVGVLDDAGTVVAASDPVSFTVEGGLGVSLDTPTEGSVLQPGTNTFSGNGQPGAVLEILDGDLVLDTVTVGSAGTWTAEVDLKAGSASISVREPGSDVILVRPVRVQVGTTDVVVEGCGSTIEPDCPAWVTRSGGLTLRMRSSPAIAADNVIARLPIGTALDVQEGPQSADGFTWYRIVTRGGNEGWVAGENLVPQPD